MQRFCRLVCFTLLVVIHSITYAKAMTQPLLVFGVYHSDTQKGQLPIIATSSDDGLNWTLSTIHLPSARQIFVNGTFAGRQMNCSKNNCVATNVSIDGDLYVLNSQDKGLSWTPVKLNSFVDISENARDVECMDDSCLVAGEKGLYKSDITGTLWHTTLTKTYLDMDSFVTCTTKTCIALGISDENTFPKFLYSLDKGENWKKATVSFSPDVNPSENQPSSSALSCTAEFCVSVGAYYKSHDNDVTAFPLVLVSHDNGVSWQQKDIQGTDYANLDKVTCHGSNCVAMGYSGNHTLPLILTSNDKGNTWKQVSQISGYPTQPASISPLDLDCDNHVCTIIGQRSNAHHQKEEQNNSTPFFTLVSHDQGQSWLYADKFYGISTSSHYILQRTANMLKCEGETCLLSSAVMDKANVRKNQTENKPVPMLFISHDRGLSWSTITKFVDMPVLKEGWWMSLNKSFHSNG